MIQEATTPGCGPGAIQDSSAAIMPDACSLVEPTPAEKIDIELQALVERNADPIAEELELRRIAKAHVIGYKILKPSYNSMKARHVWKEQQTTESVRQAQAEQSNEKEDAEIKRVLAWLREQESLVPTFHWVLTELGHICGLELATTLLLSHGARLLPTSTAFVFFGASSSGKSDGVIKAAKMLPPEVVISITSMSDQALNYMGDIKGKYLTLGEIAPQVDGQDDPRQMMMRQLISENKITRGVVDRPDGKTNTYKEIVTEGPAVIIATTTKEPSKFNDEFQNRNIWVASPDSPEVTAAVLDSVAKSAENPGSEHEMLSLTIKAFQQFHRELQPLPVRIPYANQIKPKSEHVTVRRLYKLILNYVRTHALLHQHRRAHEDHNGVEVLVATVADYEAAYRVLVSGAPRVLEACCPAARKVFYEVLKPALEAAPMKSLTTAQVRKLLKQPSSTLHRWLGDYVKDELLIEGGKDLRQNVYFLNDEPETTQELGLVHPSEIK